ncbi:unnamed protein product [Amoebophrya sp. A120]|nr:unnamed protein product [Amoebophrya sp. A120]|eukprot:GSA120T00026343001.1
MTGSQSPSFHVHFHINTFHHVHFASEAPKTNYTPNKKYQVLSPLQYNQLHLYESEKFILRNVKNENCQTDSETAAHFCHA